MKILIIVAIIVMLAIVGLVAVNAFQSNADDAEPEKSSGPVCSNSCTADNVCSNVDCGARVGRSCGC